MWSWPGLLPPLSTPSLPNHVSSVANTALSHPRSLSHHSPLPHRRELFPARIPVNHCGSSSCLFLLFPTNPHSTSQPDVPSSNSFIVCHPLLNPWGRRPSAQAKHFGRARGRQGLRHLAVASCFHFLAPAPHYFCPVSLPEAELHHAL